MKQHNIQVNNDTTENNLDIPIIGGNTVTKHSKKQLERVDLDKIYEGYL